MQDFVAVTFMFQLLNKTTTAKFPKTENRLLRVKKNLLKVKTDREWRLEVRPKPNLGRTSIDRFGRNRDRTYTILKNIHIQNVIRHLGTHTNVSPVINCHNLHLILTKLILWRIMKVIANPTK